MRKIIFNLIEILTFNFYFQRKKNRRLYILMFHQVSDEQKIFYRPTPVAVFEGICKFLAANHKVIHLADVSDHFKKSDKSAVVISFDDGHYDIVSNCLPILKKYGLKFNINIDTEILETRKPQDFVRVYDILNQTSENNYFDSVSMTQPISINRQNPVETENAFTALLSTLLPEERRAFVDRLENKLGKGDFNYSKMLSADDIKTLASFGVEVGSHSHTHPIFTKISAELVKKELATSKRILENLTQKRIRILAYPNGQFNAEIEQIALQEGFEILLKTEDKINCIDSLPQKAFFRINQYFGSVSESLASMYGFHSWIVGLKKRLKGF
jgi:peptidoglycan/xylan/chitin deacetylase (PgdA/CDA1 family)